MIVKMIREIIGKKKSIRVRQSIEDIGCERLEREEFDFTEAESL